MGRKGRRKTGKRSAKPKPRGGGRTRTVLLLAVVAAAVVLAVATWQEAPPLDAIAPAPGPPRKAAPRPAPDAAPTHPGRDVAAPAEGAEVPARFQPLIGDWVRPDGGYVLSVSGIATGGAASVAYHNPRPIHVERAETREERGQVGLFVELRDRGYPGSTYTLVYEPRADQLKGLYFQAAQGATYDVVFVRRQAAGPGNGG